ncbi:MAG: DUF3810 family protein [Flavobacteriales bacterium]
MILKRFGNFLKENKGFKWALITLAVLCVFKLSPWLAEHLYREFLFQIFRVVWDHTLGLLPFPLVYLLLVALPFILYFYTKRYERTWSSLLLWPLNVVGWMVTFFFWMWGYNYCAPHLLNENAMKKMTVADLHQFGLEVAADVNWWGDKIDRNKLMQSLNENFVDDEFSLTVGLYLSGKDRTCWPYADFRLLHDGGLMRKFGVGGIYLPFVGQGHSSDTHHYLYKPFVAAHELSHAYGITDEGEADYVAYKALTYPSAMVGYENEMKYCAELELLRSIRSQLYLINDSLRVVIDSTLLPQVLQDIKEMRENALLYTEYIHGLQEAMNDAYLKTMGIQSGVMSYDRFVEMVWNDRNR